MWRYKLTRIGNQMDPEQENKGDDTPIYRTYRRSECAYGVVSTNSRVFRPRHGRLSLDMWPTKDLI
jgi:hypothetical protein